MPIPAEDRPLGALRAETIDRLILNYGHGKLSLDAFERRLDQAIDAKSHDVLTRLTEDLDVIPDERYADTKQRELSMSAAPGSSKDVEHLIHVFAGSNRAGAWTVAREIRMLNIFGGADLDFSDARFSAPTTRIRMVCIFGGATLRVPEGVDVQSNALCFFGGIDNRARALDGGGGPTLIIEGLLFFGGAKIAVKRSLRERLIGFADALRSTFGQAA